MSLHSQVQVTRCKASQFRDLSVAVPQFPRGAGLADALYKDVMQAGRAGVQDVAVTRSCRVAALTGMVGGAAPRCVWAGCGVPSPSLPAPLSLHVQVPFFLLLWPPWWPAGASGHWTELEAEKIVGQHLLAQPTGQSTWGRQGPGWLV